MDNKIYLDHNSNALMDLDAKNAMIEMLQEDLRGNPSSSHFYGRKAKSIVENARNKMKEAVGLSFSDRRYNVVFTASCTEANNLSILGCKGYTPITSSIEHHSVLTVIGNGQIQLHANGKIDMEHLEKILFNKKQEQIKTLVCIALANSSIGVIQDIKEIAKLVHQYDGLLQTDVAQAFGKIPIDIADLDPDIATFSSHKMGGPSGVGVLMFKESVQISPIMRGGKQEMRVRPGSHNTVAIHAFGVACDNIPRRINAMNNPDNPLSCYNLRSFMENTIMSHAKDAVIFSTDVARIPNTSSIMMPNVKSEIQIAHFDQYDIAVGAGYACASGVSDVPHVHAGLGVDKKDSACTIRVSSGPETTQEDIVAFTQSWKTIYDKLAHKS